MNDLIRKLYEEIYSPKVTPYELVANARLDNYLYVNMAKHETYLNVESCCTLESNQRAVFTYRFDLDDKLVHLSSKIGDKIEVVYDREKEIEKLRSKILNLVKTEELAV